MFGLNFLKMAPESCCPVLKKKKRELGRNSLAVTTAQLKHGFLIARWGGAVIEYFLYTERTSRAMAQPWWKNKNPVKF
jgi:hypothetical protein